VIGERGVETKRGDQGRKDGITIDLAGDFGCLLIASDTFGVMAKNNELWPIRE
jgi:hypothetical protein